MDIVLPTISFLLQPYVQMILAAAQEKAGAKKECDAVRDARTMLSKEEVCWIHGAKKKVKAKK